MAEVTKDLRCDDYLSAILEIQLENDPNVKQIVDASIKAADQWLVQAREDRSDLCYDAFVVNGSANSPLPADLDGFPDSLNQLIRRMARQQPPLHIASAIVHIDPKVLVVMLFNAEPPKAVAGPRRFDRRYRIRCRFLTLM
jgi:hypothetical protein